MMEQSQGGQAAHKHSVVRWALIAAAVFLMLCVLLVAVVAVLRWRNGTATVITSTSPLPVGTSTHALVVDGIKRTYIVYRPVDLTESAPLVVMLHGGYGSAARLNAPTAGTARRTASTSWSPTPTVTGPPGTLAAVAAANRRLKNIDDVAFITAMVRQIGLEVNIDPSRVYATGISNGGIMDYTLACQTTLFAAIGPDSATQLGPCTQPNPVSVIHIHGTADTRIRYNGGEGDGTAHINGPAIPDLNATWRAIDQCGPPSVTVNGVVTTSNASCPNGRNVELITIAGAGHQWPGGQSKPLVQKLLNTDPPSTALNATSTIWQFFAQHHK